MKKVVGPILGIALGFAIFKVLDLMGVFGA